MPLWTIVWKYFLTVLAVSTCLEMRKVSRTLALRWCWWSQGDSTASTYATVSPFSACTSKARSTWFFFAQASFIVKLTRVAGKKIHLKSHMTSYMCVSFFLFQNISPCEQLKIFYPKGTVEQVKILIYIHRGCYCTLECQVHVTQVLACEDESREQFTIVENYNPVGLEQQN